MQPGTDGRVAGGGIFRTHFASGVTVCTLLVLGLTQAMAAELSVSVQDRSAHGLAGIVVLAEPDQPTHDRSAVRRVVMDQIHMQFVPNVLVIQTGSAVDFPNSDQIRHQVYSFSRAKTFELSLYAGHKYPPVVFDRAGLVVVGCNIHDNMIGYIYVTDSPFFGRTDVSGRLLLHGLPAGGYTLTIWHPGMREPPGDALRRHITLAADEHSNQSFTLTRPLRSDMSGMGDMGNKRWAQD